MFLEHNVSNHKRNKTKAPEWSHKKLLQNTKPNIETVYMKLVKYEILQVYLYSYSDISWYL